MTNRAGACGRSGAVFAPATLGALALGLFGGCSGSNTDYPPNLSFPSRTDRLVLKAPDTAPAAMNKPGEIVAELAALDATGGKTLDPTSRPADARRALDQFLRDAFGTPAAPHVTGAEILGLTAEELAEGSKLYRKQCLQCHNLTGDGRGPSGLWVIPYPRDFRRGAFKFTSTGTAKPRRADILRTLAEGLPGTAMPSFGKLPDAERERLARFVAYLAIRGEVEFDTLAAEGVADVPGVAAQRARAVLAEWEKAETSPPPAGLAAPPDDGEPGSPNHAEAVRRGHALFTAKADNSCVTCHADYGRKPVLRYDVWGTVARPADFTETTWKGGKRPEDVFARVRGGVAAVGMPGHPEYTDRQAWDVVRFVRSAAFPRELPDDVRAAVYPNP